MTSQDRLSRFAVRSKMPAAISPSASSRKPIAAYAAWSSKGGQEEIATRSCTQDTQASLEAGSRQRWATSAKSTRSTTSSQTPPARRLHERSSDPEPVPELVEHVRAAEAPDVDDLDIGSLRRSGGFGRLEEPADRRDEPGEGLPVHLVRPAEVVDHLRDGRTGHGVTLVVGELEIADDRAVLVRPARLPQVHAYKISISASSSQLPVCLRHSRRLTMTQHSDQGRCIRDPPSVPTNSVTQVGALSPL